MFLGYRYYVCVFGFMVPNLYLNGCVQRSTTIKKTDQNVGETTEKEGNTRLNSIKIAKSCSPVLRRGPGYLGAHCTELLQIS